MYCIMQTFYTFIMSDNLIKITNYDVLMIKFNVKIKLVNC